MPSLGKISVLKDRATERWRALRRDHAWLDHTATGYAHYKDQHGDHLAAAITYFSFLALFPLILLGVSIAGYVLAASPDLQQQVLDHVAAQLPGGFGDTVSKAITTAIQQRAAVGVVGLVGVALTGLGWIDNLRTAVDTLWGLQADSMSFLTKKAADALILVGLGLAALISVGITAFGTGATHQLLSWIHADKVTGAGTLTGALAVLLSIIGSVLIFAWVIVRLPDAPVTRRTAIKASVLAAIGFEVLKLIGTYYIARVTQSPAGSVIGPALGVLVWINLVSRYLLFCVAWAATAPDTQRAPDPLRQPVAGPPSIPAPERAGFSPAAIAAGLFSAGVTIGAAASAVRLGRRRQATDRPQ